ncbi:MAG TPA: hypothetical protein VFQ53_33500 [Kofleriaceae bacterium]|nr:hypothetical protein [Kofleriaceae bacterium]
MRALAGCVIVVAACGRWHFDELGGPGAGDGGPDAPIVQGDAVPACVALVEPASCTTIVQPTTFALGGWHGCAARPGNLACWGSNTDDQLGLCAPAMIAEVPVAGPALDVAQLALGEIHSCARTTAGQLFCWGSSFEGEAGGPLGTTDPLARTITGTWQDVSARRFHTCGIQSDGSLYCWGRNVEGELGIGSAGTDVELPQRVGISNDWTQVRAAGLFTCGLQGTTASCWGDNPDGQLGNGTKQSSAVPVPVSGGVAFATLAGGKQHMCGLDTSNQMWCWGQGNVGQLGNGKTGPTANELVPFLVPGGPWSAIGVGWFETCGLDMAGGLYCWGDNTQGTIAPTAPATIATPFLVDAGPFDAVAAGMFTTCARTTAGELRCWGVNDMGQLGVGDLMPRSTGVALCFAP